MNNKEAIQIKVIPERCPQNHPCPAVNVCPVGALAQKGNAAPVLDEAKCTRCGKCTKACPMNALSIVTNKSVV